MKTSVLDFIDSETLREYLSHQTLEPAIECLLIMNSENNSFEKKLKALKERYEKYSSEEFKKGDYDFGGGDFKSALKEYIDRKESVYNEFIKKEDGYVYSYDDIPIFVFDTFERTIETIKHSGHVQDHCIIKQKVNNTDPDKGMTMIVTWSDDLKNIECQNVNSSETLERGLSFNETYFRIPHYYLVGSLIKFVDFDNRYLDKSIVHAVVVDVKKTPENQKPTREDMFLRCMIYEENESHSCGGRFISIYLPILKMECATELTSKDIPLIRLSNMIKGRISPAEFIEEFSDGKLKNGKWKKKSLQVRKQAISSLTNEKFISFFTDPKSECEGKTTGYLGSWDYPEIMDKFRDEVVRAHEVVMTYRALNIWAEMREKYFNGRSYVYPDEMIMYLNSFDSIEIIGFLHYCTVYKERFHDGAYGVYAKEGYIGKLLLKLKEIKDSNNQL